MTHYVLTSLVMRLVDAFRNDEGFLFADLLEQASEIELITFHKVVSTFAEVMYR